MLSYYIKAKSTHGEDAIVEANNGVFKFDASSGRKDGLPNPAELLLSALTACVLKNVERFSEILKYEYTKAEIDIDGVRNDNPPYMSQITFSLRVASDMDEKKLNLLLKNIFKFGTITNTLVKSTNLKGSIEFLK